MLTRKEDIIITFLEEHPGWHDTHDIAIQYFGYEESFGNRARALKSLVERGLIERNKGKYRILNVFYVVGKIGDDPESVGSLPVFDDIEKARQYAGSAPIARMAIRLQEQNGI